jgi:myo-inositol catabolism protein IolS
MQYRPLGKTGLNISTVAMGCWAIAGGSVWGDQDEGEAMAAIQTALDIGINFFDTAEGYGESEELLGKGLGSRRGEAIIASKVSGGHLYPDDLVAACERSLDGLGTDYIDVYQIHWPSRDVPLADTLGAMVRLQEQGKIRHIGVSNFGPNDLDDLKATGVPCASNQVIYSLLTRAIEFAVLPKCREENTGVLPYSPLAQGLLTGKFRSVEEVGESRTRTRHFSSDRPQARHGGPGFERETFDAIAAVRGIAERLALPMSELSLAWCLHQPGVTSVIAGARNPAQVRENAAAADRALSPSVVAELSAVTDELKNALGPNIDLWQSEENARTR